MVRFVLMMAGNNSPKFMTLHVGQFGVTTIIRLFSHVVWVPDWASEGYRMACFEDLAWKCVLSHEKMGPGHDGGVVTVGPALFRRNDKRIKLWKHMNWKEDKNGYFTCHRLATRKEVEYILADDNCSMSCDTCELFWCHHEEQARVVILERECPEVEVGWREKEAYRLTVEKREKRRYCHK